MEAPSTPTHGSVDAIASFLIINSCLLNRFSASWGSDALTSHQGRFYCRLAATLIRGVGARLSQYLHDAGDD
jgi:hypothetical protein